MKYRLLGKSGLRVSELALGTMTFGDDWGWGASREESRRMFDAYVEAGGNFIDTANAYTNGSSEKLVGEFIQSNRNQFVVATKYTLTTQPTDPNASGNHRKNMVQALEASLRRLKTDYVDLYWVHAWDFTTPTDEVLRGLDDLIRAGKVLYIGISDAPAWIVSHANTMAELRGWSRFVGLQIEYSLIQRTPERELLPMAHAFDIAVTAWGAIGGGVLSGKYKSSTDVVDSKRSAFNQWRATERNLRIAATVSETATSIGATPTQVALKWLRNQNGIVIPIVGARTVQQLNDNLGALSIQLSNEQMNRLTEVSAVELGFPHDFLARESIQKVVFGTAPILNHRIWARSRA